MAGRQVRRPCLAPFNPATTSEQLAVGCAPIVQAHLTEGTARAPPEVVEKFTKYIEMIALVFRITANRAQHGNERFHQLSPKSSLKRASSRTKSSKRRLAAASSRKANHASALADSAHSRRATCARSPRSLKMRIRSVIIFTVNSYRPSPMCGDYKCPDAAIDGAIPETARQGFSRLRCGLFHSRGTARLDLISQWGTLTIGDGRIASRWRLASGTHCVHRYICKSCSLQIGANPIDIVVAMRGARQETRRIIRKNRRQRVRDG